MENDCYRSVQVADVVSQKVSIPLYFAQNIYQNI